MAICYYFIEGATKLLDESASIMRFMKVFTILAIVIFCVLVGGEVYMIITANDRTKPLCKTWYFIPPNMLNLLLTIVFLTQAKRISSFFNIIKDRQMATM
jgi:hypothetical protein